MKPIVLRQAAEADIDRAFAYYLAEAGADAASQFVDEVDQAMRHIGHHPATGSPRFGLMCDVPGLRSWLLKRFPYTVFYLERDQHLDVLRVLHQHTDIPAQLT